VTEPIVSHGGHGLPFSKGLTAQSLSASGLSPPRAFELAREVERRLLADGTSEIDLAGLRELTGEVLLAAEGEGALRRWRGWSALDRLDPPLIVLVGGAAGVGKSTLASMLAARLGITRVIATDVIRQVLRSFFTAEAVPAVHASAFELDLEGSPSRPSSWAPAPPPSWSAPARSARRWWWRGCTPCRARSTRSC